MSIDQVEMKLPTLWYHSHDDSWRLDDHGYYVNSTGHKFMIIGARRSARSAAATIIFDGLPVFTVIGDRDTESEKPYASGWRWAWPQIPVERPELETTVRFLVNPLGELGTGGLFEDEAVMNMMRYDRSIDTILEEFGGEGHDTVAFVGIIADALHKLFPDQTPEVKGF